MTITRRRPFVAGVLFVVVLSTIAEAGGPLEIFAPGQPFLWGNGGVAIPFNPDQGGLGPLTNAQAVAQTTDAFAAWQAIPSATATHVNAGALSVDVNQTNFLPFLAPTAPDGLSAIVYDADGAIFNLLFGPGSGVLGFAGPEWLDVTTGEIIEGVAFLNGGSLLGPSAFPVAEFLSVQVHEFGHYQNLAHTVVNGQIAGFGDHRGPSPFQTFPPPPTFVGRIETMYPFLFINGGQATPHPDDIAMFSSLYPEPSFAVTTATITGQIIAPNNSTRLTGVNVIARNIANPYDDAVSAISSDFTRDYSPGAPLVGTYTLRGLTPGASYAVYVDQIIAGGFSTPPRGLPGPEEFFNGAAESNDGTTDLPSVFTAVSAAAGATASNINIVFNRLPEGPLPMGDDTSFELFPDFTIRFCGQSYESVWVNANGNLTFGAPSGAFTESAAAFLQGPPRLAGLWDDLNPAAGGTVAFSTTNHSLTVTFTNVPEFTVGGAPGGANSFTMTLRQSPFDGSVFNFALHGGQYSVDYDTLSATDGLAGYSCGGKVTSGFELETNLSSLRFPIVLGLQKAAVYEIFTTDNDLDDERFEVFTPKPFRDEFEPNNILPSAELLTANGRNRSSRDVVKLPFTTANKFTAIEPLGDDVDFFRFRAKAGDIVAIETLPGSRLDTMIGLFDDAGNLLLLDDDGGSFGVGGLSRLLVQFQVDGTFAVGVTTWPDFDFTGDGFDFGRYVLNISSYTGTLHQLAEDGSIEIPLTTFQFPFQGAQWSSVWVNANGNLTFGTANADFTESVAELLSGPPRIAPLWDDLSPSNFLTGALQGLVITEERHGSLLVHYVSVPEFLDTGTNYFTVELDKKGAVTISYGATNRSDGIVGISEGGGAVDPGPTDLSENWWLTVLGTTYEQFIGSFATFGGTDLSFATVKFRKR
jgi:hypothetical protein